MRTSLLPVLQSTSRDSIGPATAILYAYLNVIDISIYDGYFTIYAARTFQEEQCVSMYYFK